MGAIIEERTWKGLEALRGSLHSFLVRHCQDENEVEDVIQETYLRAVRYRNRLSELGRLRSWTTRIALNVLADRRRRERRYVTRPQDTELEGDAYEGVAEAVEAPVRIGRFEVDREDAVALLRRVLVRFPAAERRLLSSFYGGDESCRRTGLDCDIPEALVKVRLFRARRKLCRAMRHRLALEHANPRPPELPEPGEVLP